jgi:hypothetical protein
MPSQDDLSQGLEMEMDLFEASLDEGTIRQRNDPYNEIQRSVITDRGLTSPYKIQALLKACIHGTMDHETKKPASLILVDYKLLNTKEGSYFASVTTRFTFSEHENTNSGNENLVAAPSVVAYAPFEEPVRFNETTGDVTRHSKLDVAMRPGIKGMSVGEIDFSKEKGSSHEQRYFDQGVASRNFDAHGRANSVWWNLIQNRSQKVGIPPTFGVAILVERENDLKFEAGFNIAVRGGFGVAANNLEDKWLRRTTVDDPIIFDPSCPPFGDLQGIDRTELGKLKEGLRLNSLSKVCGLKDLEAK